ncbi:MAG: aspartate/glutamate racemase family protein [Candidatus Odinarchaeota archaeon]
MKRIGILGGISYESTIKYYDIILEKYYEKFENYNYPEVIIFSLNFQRVIDLELNSDKNCYIEYLMEGIKSLEKAGASFIIIAANSPHAVYEDLTKLSKLPILSIVKATIEKAKEENLKKLLLLGIKFTMQSTFYQEYCKKLEIEVIIPTEEEQEIVEEIIFNELVIGLFKKESKKKLFRIINNYDDIDGVILGCTELPLILPQRDSKIKLLDTLELHAQATLDYFLTL